MHGIQNIEEGGKIEIRLYKNLNNKLIIEVKNPVPPNEDLNNSKDFKGNNISVTNIKERLKIYNPTVLKGEKEVINWNKGNIQVLLAHPASAGHGLNLQAGGSTLIWFGLTWSLELYQQTNTRLWRQGQTAETVVIQHIVAKDTVDEHIMKALAQKNTTQSALMDAVKAELEDL